MSPSEQALAYAMRVREGSEPSCRWVRLAVDRFFRDIDRGRWHLDLDRADRVCRAVSMFRHYQGPMAGQPLELLPWQCFVMANVFGWVDGDGYRRFREAFVPVPRGNGKTTWAAALGLYMLAMDGEASAQVFSAAAKATQARIALDAARMIAKGVSPTDPKTGKPVATGWAPHFSVDIRANELLSTEDGGYFRFLESQSKGLDGLNVHFAIPDEICSHKTSEVHDALRTGMSKRRQALMFSIGTATNISTGIGRTKWRYLERILLEQIEDERFFGIIYTIDDADDPWDPAAWRKANPSWGAAVDPVSFEAVAKQAQSDPARESAFKTRHLNVWVGAEEGMFSPRRWAELGTEITLAEFEGERCTMGVDMATAHDLASIGYLFFDRDPWVFIGRAFLPSDEVEAVKIDMLQHWARTGHLELHDGASISIKRLEQEVLDACSRFRVAAIGFDEWQSRGLIEQVEASFPEVDCVALRPTPRDMSAACRELQRRVRDGGIVHDNNPVTAWCVGNVVGKEDEFQNVRPTKEHNDNKIDVAVAMIQATAVALASDTEEAGESELFWV